MKKKAWDADRILKTVVAEQKMEGLSLTDEEAGMLQEWLIKPGFDMAYDAFACGGRDRIDAPEQKGCTYPGTNVLVNLYGIMDSRELMRAEIRFSSRGMARVLMAGPDKKKKVPDLVTIHRKLFGELYPWAGQYRDIQTWKGGTRFTAPDKISDSLDELYEFIWGLDGFKGLEPKDAADILADILVDLNGIHPFREGNGRTQRLFLMLLAEGYGYRLDLTRISENDMRNASMAAARGNRNLMRYLFRESVSRTDPAKKKWGLFSFLRQ